MAHSKDYEVRFFHKNIDTVKSEEEREYLRKNKLSAVTFCHIESSDGRIISEAEARCSELDQFSKKRGRMISFRRALRAAGLPREERVKIGDIYNGRK